MKTIIRDATHDDLDSLMDIAAEMHAESPRFSSLTFAPDKVLQLFISLIQLPNGLLLVAEQDGIIIGGIAALATPHWMSYDLISDDVGLFISAEYRGGVTAARLVKKYMHWARDQGVMPGWTQLGIMTGVHVEETAALYRALGLQQCSLGFGG